MSSSFQNLVCLSAVACVLGCAGADDEQDSSQSPDSVCIPSCETKVCGDDGCGESCGACGPGQSCGDSGQCAEDCSLDCATAGVECGTHCGQVCGSCATGTHCDNGQCTCSPSCGGKTCADDNGCGGTCSPCPSEVSCTDCTLQLKVVDRELTATGQVKAVVLAIDYVAAADTPLPSLANVSVRIDGPMDLLQVGIGAPVLEADKRLLPDASTGRPYRTHDDGRVSFVIMSPTSNQPIGSGRWILMRVEFTDAVAGDQPMVARLVPHKEMLAPEVADAALWSEILDGAVVVWPVDVSLPGKRDANDR